MTTAIELSVFSYYLAIFLGFFYFFSLQILLQGG